MPVGSNPACPKGSNSRAFSRWRKNTEWQIDLAGVAKQPAQAIRHSVFSRLFNSGNTVNRSADSSNAVDGIDSIGTASLATDNAEPLSLSQVMSVL